MADGSFGETQNQVIRGYRGEAVVIQGDDKARNNDNTVPDNIQGNTINDCSAPSVEVKEKVKQARTDCKFIKGRCEKHECAVGIENVSSKVWAWLERKKEYGWKYKKTKMKYCMAMGKDPGVWRDLESSGSMAIQGGSVSAAGVKGKV